MTLRRGYLNDLRRRLHLEPREQEEILHELEDHIEDEAQELIEAGIPSDEAVTRALDRLGALDKVASRFYEAHTRGSWYHTALAVLPHVLLALMFALHLWTRPIWVALMLVVAIVISVLGWRKGRPRWTYPWLGYCLVAPIASWGLAISAVGYGAWGVVMRQSLPLGFPIYIASFVYFTLSLWIVIKVLSRAARPDWVMASLAVLPVPFLVYWFFYFYTHSEALLSSGQALQEIDSSASIVFLIVAAATAIFFRIGRRLVRVAILVITAPSIMVLAWYSYQGGPSSMGVFAFCVISLAALLSPALFDLKEGDSQQAAYSFEKTSGRSQS